MSETALRQLRTTADGPSLAWRERPGSGPTIGFLHGLGGSSLDFTWLVDVPTLSRFRLLLIDAPGFGESDRPDDGSFTIETHAGQIADLLRDVTDGPSHLVGHSMGGSIAIALTHRHADLVRSIVVAEPNLDPGAGTLSGHIARQSEDRFVARGYPALVYQTERAVARGDAVATAFLRSLQLASPLAMYRSAVSLRADRSPTFREQLESLALPRSMLWGERTPPLHPPLVDRAIRQVTLPDAGHQLMVDNPTAFADAVREAVGDP